MRAQIIFAAAFAIASGCAYAEDRVTDVGTYLSPVDERVIHGDTQFTPAERTAAERACLAWGAFTHGRVHLVIRWDMTDMTYMDLPPPLLYRVTPSPATGDYGGRTQGQLIWWVPDTCIDLQACVEHEFGHMLGLEHVAEAGQVMSAHNPARVFGVADARECLRVGVCRDRAADVTTVTVTIDPSVPPVEPDYPRSMP